MCIMEVMKFKLNRHRLPLISSLMIICLVLFVGTATVAMSGKITGYELRLFRQINEWPDGWRSLAIALTSLGTAWMLFAVTLISIATRHYRLALRIFAGGALAYVLTEILKRLVMRPRPFVILPDVHVREAIAPGYGFPSGHTALATTISLLIFLNLPKRWRWLAIIWFGLVGLSRIYLGVHAPLDVVGGFLIGCMVVLTIMVVQRKLQTVMNITGLKLS